MEEERKYPNVVDCPKCFEVESCQKVCIVTRPIGALKFQCQKCNHVFMRIPSR